MSTSTSIEWTRSDDGTPGKTWNPVRGCSVITPGCVNCYAMKQAHRFSGEGKAYHGLTKQTKAGPQWTGVVRTIEDALLEPLSWRKPARIFVNSMSDLFHEDVPDTFIAEVFAVMAVCGAREHDATSSEGRFGAKWDAKRFWYDWKGPHTFQVLTKRPQRMQRLLTAPSFRQAIADAAYRRATDQRDAGYLAHQIGAREEWGRCYPPGRMWPLSNVWLGVSCENQQYADERIPLLLQTPAAVRWVSAEPLLGPIDFTRISVCEDAVNAYGPLRVTHDALTGWEHHWPKDRVSDLPRSQQATGRRLDWVVVGGESGPGARPCDLAWIRSIVQQCKAADVPVFVKQLGSDPRGLCDWPHHDECPPKLIDERGCDESVGHPPFSLQHAVDDAFWPCRLTLKDRKGGDLTEWPADLQVREYPVPDPPSPEAA